MHESDDEFFRKKIVASPLHCSGRSIDEVDTQTFCLESKTCRRAEIVIFAIVLFIKKITNVVLILINVYIFTID